MLRPNTELLKEEVNQSVPRFVDVSKGTLTSKTRRSEALNKATLKKKSKQYILTTWRTTKFEALLIQLIF